MGMKLPAILSGMIEVYVLCPSTAREKFGE